MARKMTASSTSSRLLSFPAILLPLVTCLLVLSYLLLSACAHKTPVNALNICSVFDQKSRWSKHAQASVKKWGTPIHVQMAILHQESGFRYDAKPGRKKLMGFIPWRRQSSAYGYAQVLDQTWKEYIKSSKNYGADRDKFKDAIDFVGWYTHQTHRQIKLSKWDAYAQYLAYHEGRTGYTNGSYKQKKWLMSVARKVERVSKDYAKQIKTCR